MPDSLRIKEIHECLNAGKFAKDDLDPTKNRFANLGYLIERIARVLGISVNSDGTVRSIRQRGVIKAGTPVPPGWNFGQWGENAGGIYQKGTGTEVPPGARDGIAVEAICNQFVRTADGDYAIRSGDYVLCENFPQLIAQLMDTIDRSVGIQAASATAIPLPNGKVAAFDNMHQILIEIAYSLSVIAKLASETHASSLCTQATTKETLAALGLPVVPKSLAIAVDIPSDSRNKPQGSIFYPGLAPDAPTITQVLGWVLQNQAPLIAHVVKP